MQKVLQIVWHMKAVSAREFQKQFRQLARELAAGQTVQVTHHGKPLGRFTKECSQRAKIPDFLANLRQAGGDPVKGDQIIREFYKSIDL